MSSIDFDAIIAVCDRELAKTDFIAVGNSEVTQFKAQMKELKFQYENSRGMVQGVELAIDVLHRLWNEEKISAIKLVREECFLSLKEAKDLVDTIQIVSTCPRFHESDSD